MQDIYAFDVGDFGKLGLLRHVMARDLSLGVLWWKTQLGSPGQDGKHLAYLSNEAYKQCDPELWEKMSRCVQSGARSIAALEQMFPAATPFFSDVIPSDELKRQTWFHRARQTVRGSDVVFCDPDNGICFTQKSASQRHVSLSELSLLHDAGHSVVVYHHLNRSSPHIEQIRNGASELREVVSQSGSVWAAHFRRGTSRVYFILAQERHEDAIGAALEQLHNSPWSRHGHFNVYALPKASDAP